ncbi:LADA_0G00562g1_1 [Lachancea dasiensis]|uniref:Phosphatidyl-N-methylethanolamine N-methyltransferase n=1 Tax=Lachancea dasiensis TaxID=1072105 RepID=A0A1G4JQQ2_9SACH|nr:LADA_0G00562g1_1 [Lachancea dasiensis]
MVDITKEFTQLAYEAKEAYVSLLSDIDATDKNFQIALFCIVFNPTFWNIVARLEYNTHFITKLTGSAKRGCYLLAFTIFSLGIVRDYFFHQALGLQPTSAILDNDIVKKVGMAVMGVGQVLVVTSMYQLGVTGTYLGDYFGILMDHIVTSFPFNVSNNPMYHGSTLSFLGTSLYYGKAAGLFATMLVNLMYNIAQQFEEPFTAKIYAKRDAEKASKSQ